MLCFVLIKSVLVNLLNVRIFTITVLHRVHHCWLLSVSSLSLFYIVSIVLASVWIFTITVLHCVHSVGFCLDLHYYCSTLCPSLLVSVWIFTITVLHCVHHCWLLSESSLSLFYIVSIIIVGFCLDLHYYCSTLCP